MSIPCIPPNAPFTPDQRAWLNGYLAGLFADGGVSQSAVQPAQPQAPRPSDPLVILYGSQTGTAEQLAIRLGKEAAIHGFAGRVVSMSEFRTVDLARESRLTIVTSTWGDGDPPDNAAAFWNHINSAEAPRLDHLNYAVLALGDRTYADFCGAGRKFDARLEQLGARRVVPRADCDTEFEPTAKGWMSSLWPALRALPPPPEPVARNDSNGAASHGLDTVVETNGSPAIAANGSSHSTHKYDRRSPFSARLLANRPLNGPGSAKDTRHIEISLEGSGLAYEVGDALGVRPCNCPQLVSDLIRQLGCRGDEQVEVPGGEHASLRDALVSRLHITQPPRTLVEAIAQRCNAIALRDWLLPGRGADLDAYVRGRDVLDLIVEFASAKFSLEEFIPLLRPLQPRLYSIASSPKAHPGEVHLTVGVVRYSSHGRDRKGVCSTFLADRVDASTCVPVFVHSAKGFRLPMDPDRPVIMIGPGTGIAPFRAFLEERRAIGAKGRNWLFFGDQKRACDFLYRTELEEMLGAGTLSRLDTAFSRDQAEKVYVQNLMLQRAAEFWSWLEAGAHVYVCGDAQRMAKDVDLALHQIVRTSGGKSAAEASEYVWQLRTTKRYQRDVYSI